MHTFEHRTTPTRPNKTTTGHQRIKGIEGVVSAAETSEPEKSASVRVETIPIMTFLSVKDHPSQRDTERHAAAAKKGHLSSSSETHRIVSMALFGGEYYKLDGHTRSLLWKSGDLPMPDTVIAGIYECRTLEELIALYDTFDNRGATKNSKDDVSSAMRYHDIIVESNMMKSYKYNNAFRLLYSLINNTKNHARYSAMETFGQFKDEIQLFDSINPNSNVFRSGAITAMMLLLKRYGEEVLPFVAGVSRNEGKKESKQCDAIFAANRVIEFSRSHSGNNFDLTAKVVSCGESWMAKRGYSVLSNGNVYVKPKEDLVGYCRAAFSRHALRKAKATGEMSTNVRI